MNWITGRRKTTFKWLNFMKGYNIFNPLSKNYSKIKIWEVFFSLRLSSITYLELLHKSHSFQASIQNLQRTQPANPRIHLNKILKKWKLEEKDNFVMISDHQLSYFQLTSNKNTHWQVHRKQYIWAQEA